MDRRRLTITIAGIVAVIIIIAVIDYFVPSEPSAPAEPPAPAGEIAPPTSTEETGVPAEPVITIKAPAEQTLSTYEQKLEDLRKVIAEVASTNTSQEVTLVLTEAEVNEQAAKQITPTQMSEDLPLEIKSVHIDLKSDNNILAEIGADIYGFTGKVKIKTQVGVEEGKPAAAVTDVSVPIPGIKDKISELAQQKIEDLLDQLTGPEMVGNEAVALEYLEIKTHEEDLTTKLLVKPRA